MPHALKKKGSPKGRPKGRPKCASPKKRGQKDEYAVTHGKYNGISLESLHDVRLTTTPINIPSETNTNPSIKVKLPRTTIVVDEVAEE